MQAIHKGAFYYDEYSFMAGKLSRLRERLRTPEWRKYGQILLMGKLLGIALVFMLALFMHPEMMGMGAHAARPGTQG